MLQIGSVGPMFGQLTLSGMHRKRFPTQLSAMRKETLRLYGVLDRQLAEHEFICGDYSIADIATYPGLLSMNFKV